MKASMTLAVGAAALVSANYPVSSVEPEYPTSHPIYPTGGAMTTSTVYSTHVYTVTSCAPTVTDCPAKDHPYVTTELVSLYTTICPVATTTPGGYVPYPTGSHSSYPAVPTTYPAGPSSEESSTPPAYPTSKPEGVKPSGPIYSTVTVTECVPTTYETVVTVKPTTPAGPSYPAGGEHSSYPAGGASTGIVPKPSTYPSAPPPFEGAASATKAGGLLMVVGLIAALL